MGKLTNARSKCEKAAEAVGELHYETWAGWVLYIIEALDSRMDRTDDERQRVLEDIFEGLQGRLNEGSW